MPGQQGQRAGHSFDGCPDLMPALNQRAIIPEQVTAAITLISCEGCGGSDRDWVGTEYAMERRRITCPMSANLGLVAVNRVQPRPATTSNLGTWFLVVYRDGVVGITPNAVGFGIER